ncbi:hypothetical protein Nepgr_018481 [Nepenthes gracilis]|uniref:RecA family profile 1 domain-containing protein n=1 Tax=Nepenthes gracilis TaxID=150966 RepID=A0AAD3SRG0_NEPGR|nr:hypothetical protein Nepgr_018481 [Nepenthes gracilis]
MKPANLLHRQNLTTQKCTLDCPVLDRFLFGGIPCNTVTEIVAESGCGKTQLCLQLLLSSQLPTSLGGSPLPLSTSTPNSPSPFAVFANSLSPSLLLIPPFSRRLMIP